jgi:hypothetical protein
MTTPRTCHELSYNRWQRHLQIAENIKPFALDTWKLQQVRREKCVFNPMLNSLLVTNWTGRYARQISLQPLQIMMPTDTAFSSTHSSQTRIQVELHLLSRNCANGVGSGLRRHQESPKIRFNSY